MYSVATARLSRAIDAAYLFALVRMFAVVALAAWVLTFVGMIAALAARGRR
jgi:hypothetical protein